jgi:hypothetical protein
MYSGGGGCDLFPGYSVDREGFLLLPHLELHYVMVHCRAHCFHKTYQSRSKAGLSKWSRTLQAHRVDDYIHYYYSQGRRNYT